MIPRRTFLFTATVILIAAAVLRLTDLGTIPPGLHFDEGANGSIVRNIAFGGYRPIFISAYTGKEVLWFYAAALIMRIMGPVIFALRLTSALFGMLGVAAAGWLIRQLYPTDPRRDALALLTMSVLAIALWLGILSRFADRAITQPLLQALSLGLLWKGLASDHARARLRWLALSGAITGLAAYTYLAVRLFPVPLVIVVITFLIAAPNRLGYLGGLAAFALGALLVFAPLGLYFANHPEAFSTRIGQVAPSTPGEVLEGWRLALQMFFLSGDPLMRFNLPGKPIFGPVLGIFFVIGLGVSVRDLLRARRPLDWVRGALLLIWPIIMLTPTALATGGITPSNLRAVGLAPLIALYPALGIEAAFRAITSIRLPDSAKRAAVPTIILFLIAGAASTLLDLKRWGNEQALYYDNDSHVAALADYLNAQPEADYTMYLATMHYRHPTLGFVARAEGESRSLFGGDALVLASTGDTFLAYTRDAFPPSEWQEMLSPYQVASPLGPDGTPDFVVYLVPETAALNVDPVTTLNYGGVIALEAASLRPAVSGTTASVDLMWQILAPAPTPDYAFVAEVCDSSGWCWVKPNPDGSIERGVNSVYTSEQWAPGERMLTRLKIPLPQGIPPGEDYTVRVSVFSAAADDRLPIVDQAGGFAGFSTEVGPLTIEANSSPDLAALPVQFSSEQAVTPSVRLIGYDLPVQAFRSGEQIQFALYWLSEQVAADSEVTVSLGEHILYQGDPVHGAHPVSQWKSGELVTDRYVLRIPFEMEAGVYPLTAQLGDSSPIDLGKIAVEGTTRRFDIPAGVTLIEPPVGLGDQVALVGYDLPDTAVEPGGTLSLTLAWRAEQSLTAAYTVFLHLVDSQGAIVAQVDRPPQSAAGLYPTDLWFPDEIVLDQYELAIPPDTAGGTYLIRVGMYLPDTAQRLSIPETADNAFVLPAQIEVR